MADKKKTKAWIRKHRSDVFVKQAQRSGLRARSAFKLDAIQNKHQLFREGSIVLELGAAPGGWTQCLVNWVGLTGRVIAVDLLPIKPIDQAILIQGDFQDKEIMSEIENEIGLVRRRTRVDIVVSDMAPNLSGDSFRDQERCLELWQGVLSYCSLFLRLKGCLVMKLFHGHRFDAFIASVRMVFGCVRIEKPDASRKASREVYLVATQFIGEPL